MSRRRRRREKITKPIVERPHPSEDVADEDIDAVAASLRDSEPLVENESQAHTAPAEMDDFDDEQELPRWAAALFFFGYSALAVVAYQLHVHVPEPSLVFVFLTLLLNAVKSVLHSGGVLESTGKALHEVMACAIVPFTLIVPFHFAAEFEISAGFFELRPEVVLGVAGLLAATGVLVRGKDLCFAKSDDSNGIEFLFVSEIVVNFVTLGLCMLLWVMRRWLLLMLGTVVFTVTLVFDDLRFFEDVGRLTYFAGVLFTYQALRVPPLPLT